MIIQLENNITPAQLDALKSEVQDLEYNVREVHTQYGDYLVGLGKKSFDIRKIGHLGGVRDIHRVSDNYKLVSRKWKAEATRIRIDDEMSIGSGDLTLMAGPCSIEGEEQIQDTVDHLVKNGIKVMRGGVYKPRSSPYSFRGLGIDGLKAWNKAARAAGIRIITEVMHTEQIADMIDYVDIFQVGARNSQNFNLLDALGEVDKPVMIKRGMSGTLEELLQSAEYVFAKGNERILLCERGIRTYEKAYRNTLDLNAIPILKEKTHLPVIVDPSHGIGLRRYVESMALAGVMAGADGLIVEVHSCPEKAFSDGQQTLNFREAGAMYQKVRKVYETREEIGGY
jgi:3-deoxy-7-phosphoheptulonate synthase